MIYYDLEHYDIRNEECNQAARAFINGWVERMNELGMIGGVYSTGRPLSQFADLPNPPAVIWAAHWVFLLMPPKRASGMFWDYRTSCGTIGKGCANTPAGTMKLGET